VLDYRNEGYIQEALLNFMALHGWNPVATKKNGHGLYDQKF